MLVRAHPSVSTALFFCMGGSRSTEGVPVGEQLHWHRVEFALICVSHKRGSGTTAAMRHRHRERGRQREREREREGGREGKRDKCANKPFLGRVGDNQMGAALYL